MYRAQSRIWSRVAGSVSYDDNHYANTYATIHIFSTIMMTNGHSSLEKYTSHFIRKGCVCEGVGDWTKTAIYWPPSSSGHSSVYFSFPWAAQPEAWGWFSLLDLKHCFKTLISNCNSSIGGLRPPSAGCWFSLPHHISSWLTSCLHSGYIIVRLPPSSCERHKSHSIQPVHGQGYILIFLDRMHLLFTLVHFLFWQLGRVGGQYATYECLFIDKLYMPKSDPQNWSLAIRCILVPYPGPFFWWGLLFLCEGYRQYILNLTEKGGMKTKDTCCRPEFSEKLAKSKIRKKKKNRVESFKGLGVTFRGVVGSVLDCYIVKSEFNFKLH